MRTNIIILLLASIITCSCNISRNNGKTQIMSENETHEQKAITNIVPETSHGEFQVALFNKICNIEQKENICISPTSVIWALSMLANGADSNTLAQITEVLGTDSIEKLNNKQKKFVDILTEYNTDIKLSVANSIWINEMLHVKEPFTAINEQFYNATINRRIFNNNTLTEINNWCAEKTNGKITEILDKLDNNTRMLILNALYFKAVWNKEFNEEATSKQPFTKENGKVVEVDMMSQRLRTAYFENDSVQIVSKPFANGEFEMLLILPNKDYSTSQISATLIDNWQNWNKYMQNGTNVILGLPKFKAEYDVSLKNTLQKCGITDAFNIEADFSLISDSPLYVDDIIQKSYISVNEYGAEASAVTMVSMKLLSARPTEHKTVIFNRPFIFAIKECITGENNILFIGKIGEPK